MTRFFGFLLVLSVAVSPALAADLKRFSGTPVEASAEGYSLTVNGRDYTIADLENDFFLYETTMETSWGPSGVFAGPKFVDVLTHAKSCACGPLVAKAAADNYAVEIPPWPDGAADALIATRLNGKPLPLDEFGPFWLIWPSMNDAVKAGDEDHAAYWIWSLVEISELR